MTIALARIDDRLIHGQVVVGWVKHVGANCIAVANDVIAADPVQKALLPMAVPPEIEVAIYRVTEAAKKFSSGAHAGQKVILLFSTPGDVLRFLQEGGALAELNVGGMRFAPGKAQVHNSLSLSEEDVRAIEGLAQRGLKMTVQMVPSDHPADLRTLLPRKE